MRADRDTYLAVVAMDQQRMVATVQDEAENGPHCRDRDVFLFRALHVEHVMPDAVFVEEGIIATGEVLPHQRARKSRQRLKSLEDTRTWQRT
jgi:hypothetical protein